MYDGWLSFAGTEIINVPRLIAYRDSMLPTLSLLDCTDCADLGDALEDAAYTNPTTDEAAWYDPDRPDSAGFLGFMPTALSGFTDSTRTAGITQSIFDGGTVGRVRKGTRDIRISGWLIGTSMAAAEAGFSWMKSVLDGAACTDCEPGDDLCFMIACPSTVTEADSYARHLRRVTCVDGPTVLATRDLSSCGGHMIQIEFALVAGSPWVYGMPTVVATASGGTLDAVIDGALVYPLTTPLRNCLTPSTSGTGGLGSIIRDPDCPVIPNPPTAPLLTTACKPLNFSTYNYVTSSGGAAPVQTDSVTVAASGAYEARPSIASTDGVNLRVIYSESPTGSNNAASVVKTRTSTNSGVTWSSATTVYDEGSGTKGSEPAALRWVDSKTKYMMATIEYDLTTSSPRIFAGRFHTSTTGAAGTWTEVSNLDALFASKAARWYFLTDFVHFDNGTTDGIIYATGYASFSTTEKNCAWVIRSTDFGATWTWLGVPHPRNSVVAFEWPALAIYPNGEIILAAAVPGTSPSIYFMKSTNGGSSWSYPKVAVTKAKGKPTMWVTRDETVMMHIADMTYPGSRNLGRTGFAYTQNRGASWGKGPNWTGSVAGTAGAGWSELANGDLAAVYGSDYSDTNANVFFRRWTQVENFLSYAMYVPDYVLGAWQEGVINLQIKTGATATRQMRVRIIPRPLDDQLPEDLDPCSVCGSFVIDYAPANTVVYVDGMTERVTMRIGNGKALPADHLVSGLDGGIFTWPTMSCGLGYYVLVDVDVDTIVDLALGVVGRE